jgi:putative ABC transport system permease protein
MRMSAETLVQDLRFGVRVLRRSAGFTLTCVILLALGIGANTAIFSVVSSVFLRPLPFPDPDRLVLLWDDFSRRGGPSRVEASLPDYVEWKARNRSFADLAVMAGVSYSLTGTGEPARLSGIRTTSNLFSVLGLPAIVGRPLLASDDTSGEPVVVISETLWRTRFGADPSLVGRSLVLDGVAHTVVGIVPPWLSFPNKDVVLWVPARFTPDQLAQASSYYAYVVGRLKPGVSLVQAQRDMSGIGQQLQAERPRTNSEVAISVTSLHEHVSRDARQPMMLLASAAGLILLIACANVAGLLIAHGASRRAELALRNVLGAAASRLNRQLLTESVLIATAGAVLGVALAVLTLRYLARLVPVGLVGSAQPTIDGRVLLFTSIVTAVVVIVVGMLPTLTSVRAGLAAVLRSSDRRVTAHSWFRNSLVVTELALTVVLLAVAGLLPRSYANVLSIDAGFNPRNVLLAQTTLPPAAYDTAARRIVFYDTVLERVRAIPGVTSAAYANFPPLMFKGGRVFVSIEGRPLPAPSETSRFIVSDRVVTDGYFSTLQVPLVRGREIQRSDSVDSQPVVVINQRMARLHWPDEDPVGRRIGFGAGPALRWMTIVGIVSDMRQMGLDLDPEPEVYVPAAQTGNTAGAFLWPQYLVVRTAGAPLSVASSVRQAIWSADRDLPVANLRSMDDVFEGELAGRNTQLTLVGAFALLALVIAAVGLYGLLAFGVSQRLRDIGVRMALGARRARVVADLARHSMTLVGVALASGLCGAFAVTRLLDAWLFRVGATDALTFFGSAMVLLIAALVACVVPALRAASVHPAVVLRGE